jgi:UPF0755 protein
MDIKPSRPRTPTPPPQPPITLVPAPQPQPIEATPSGLVPAKKKSRLKKILLWGGLGLLVIILGIVGAAWFWYQAQLAPLGTDTNEHIKVVIESGSTPVQIADLLEQEGVIRSSTAFGLYTRFSQTQNQLQAGSYRLSPADSTPDIVGHLVSGNVDTFDITFLPGATLKENREVLLKASYSEAEVDTALSATYESPLFKDKPASADLEGYIYGDTYKFGSGATVQEILQYTFDTYASVIQENDLVAKFEARGLNLYEGITLASIVQRESGGNDEAQIASVFYNRLASDMVLGSDVTYQYAADKAGVPRDTNLDSPYNTRRYPGLPPGPIAAPGLRALLGVANPAQTDYLYFLSGDDNVTYYGTTLAEHEKNIADHCKEKCQIL